MALPNVRHSGRVFLPHKAVPLTVLRTIEAGIIEGWRVLKQSPPTGFTLATAKEEEVTTALYETIVNRVLYPGTVNGFSYDIFRVAREPKVKSYNGGTFRKMPDLFFYLIDDRRMSFPDQDGLFAECKPIDKKHGIGKHYCDSGIQRFVFGEYAWAMREAMMIGYAVFGLNLPNALAGALSKGARKTRLPTRGAPVACNKTISSASSQQVYSTTHGRNFIYPDTNTQAEDIVIRHLWLRR